MGTYPINCIYACSSSKEGYVHNNRYGIITGIPGVVRLKEMKVARCSSGWQQLVAS